MIQYSSSLLVTIALFGIIYANDLNDLTERQAASEHHHQISFEEFCALMW